jgi:hypothetical protein
MSSLINIAKGWTNVLTHRNSKLAFKRLEACDGCPYKTQLSPVGTVLISKFNASSSTFYCSQCGCPLAAKVTVASEQCPKDLWPKEDTYY